MRQIKISLAIILLLLVIAVIYRVRSNYKTVTISAPELFGDGELHTVSLRSISLGYTDAWGAWLYIEYRPTNDRGQCLFVPLQKVLSDSQPIYCEKFYKSNGVNFQGFIYFRGHERKFCGGNFIPLSCLKIGEVTHGLY